MPSSYPVPLRSRVRPSHRLAKRAAVNSPVDLDLKNGLLGRFREPAGRETDGIGVEMEDRIITQIRAQNSRLGRFGPCEFA
jgi:hypothetical protein